MCIERYAESYHISSPQSEEQEVVAKQPDTGLQIQEQLQQKKEEVASLRESIEVCM